jgi:DNA polymerase-4
MLTSDRHIAHLDMDNFYISIEQLKNSKLVGKPLLIGGSNDRGVVAACSEEARRFGIYKGMQMRVALRLCKYAAVLQTDFEKYSTYSKLITEIIKSKSPLVEKSAIDEFFIDLTGMDKFFGCKKFIDELKQTVYKESGLPSSYGLASNKLVSKVAASQIKPNGQLEIPFGSEKSFLAPLSVVKIPGVGKDTAFSLIRLGVETIKALSEIPIEMLQDILGKNASELWKRANGIDSSPVIPYKEEKSITTEKTFQQDTIDVRILDAEVVRMTEKIAYELRRQNRLTGSVIVKLEYSDQQTCTVQKAIPYSNADHTLLRVARELFQKLHTQRLLVRMLGIRFSNLIPGVYQIDLFADRHETIKLYQSIDHIKGRFGERLLMRGASFCKRL